MRATRRLAAAALWVSLAVLAPAPIAAQTGVSISTPYSGVAVEPGQTVTFDLQVRAPSLQRVAVSVTEVPKGWRGTLRGGGFVVDAVFTGPKADDRPALQLEVQVPSGAKRGTYRVVVTATGESGGTATLPLDLRVARKVAGGVTMTTDFPTLQGASDATFTWDVTISNNAPRATNFNLEVAAPEGWLVDARPSGQQQAATIKVEAGSTGTISVSADPPDDVAADVYPIEVRAVGGGQEAFIGLEVEITGNFSLSLNTPDERLNADVVAGRTTNVALVITNTGSAPLVGVSLTGTPPADWEVTFNPKTIDQIPPGQTAETVATIKPSGDAVAGDYVVTMRAETAEANSEIEIRTAVKTSGLFGAIGILLIIAALGGLGYVFRKYGRR